MGGDDPGDVGSEVGGEVGGDDGGDAGGDDGGDAGGDDGGAGLGVGVCELLRCGVGVGEGADDVGLFRAGRVAGALFAGSCAARLMAALLLVADGTGPLIVEPARDPSVLRGLAPARPADWPGAGVLPVLCIVGGEAAE